MKVTIKKLSVLKHPEKNVRIHSEQQIRELKRSLEKFGQTRALVIDENNIILIGNGLYEAMVSLGYQEATVYVKAGLSENDKKKLMIADNKTYALGIDNLETLNEFLEELQGDLDIPGYDEEILLRNHVDIPEIYLFLWQSGSSKRQMRVSQFFSVDTARSLVKMNEYYPDLMERIIRREPNAYLAALYWDSEMFGRSSRKRKEAEAGQEQKDYRQELIYLFNHMDVFFDTPHKRHVAERYRNFFMAVSAIATPTDYKHIYEGLISGDPKMRAFRALYQRIYGRYINDAKKGEHHG